MSDGDTNNNWRTGTVPMGLEKKLAELEARGRIETIQTTALLRSARIQRSDLET